MRGYAVNTNGKKEIIDKYYSGISGDGGKRRAFALRFLLYDRDLSAIIMV